MLLEDSEQATHLVRTAADLVIAAFFAEEKDKQREAHRKKNADLLNRVLQDDAPDSDLDAEAAPLYKGPRPLHTFHWPVEFPEVFSRSNPGFDAFVGNPPFAGKNTLIAGTRAGYPDWLKTIHEESHGASDLVAHFYRRAFNLLRSGGTFGLIATNTIAQGDTRSTGLRWICTHDGTIYAARKRVKWPAPGAAVIVSVVHVARAGAARPTQAAQTAAATSPSTPGPLPRRPYVLDGREVDRITAFLFHDGGHEDPARLAANADKSFQGSIVLGMGFTFDDDNPEATPLAEMERLIVKDPRNRERIFPYIGGEEVNDSPTHAHCRYIISFGGLSEAEARTWPALMAIVEAKVRPDRLSNNRESYRRWWWHYAEKRGELYEATHGLGLVLACTLHSPHLSFAFLDPGSVFSHALAVFALSRHSAFCCLQSRSHEGWTRFLGSSLKDDLRYTPSDCFETFPFPPAWQTKVVLDDAGRDYYDFRAALMVRNDEGLTKTYNRFHDPAECDPDILKLRELHDAMDRAVLDAYGWTDIQPKCEFLLDYEEEDDPADDGSKKKAKKKPWRYRWPDGIRDEVLARLLALNQERARAEQLTGEPASGGSREPTARRSRQGAGKSEARGLFG
jgi:hypothetical protein